MVPSEGCTDVDADADAGSDAHGYDEVDEADHHQAVTLHSKPKLSSPTG